MVKIDKLHINNISKTFIHFSESKKVLNSVSSYLKPKEIVFLCGLNGSGKTTLFKIIAGILNADDNSDGVYFDKKKQSNRELKKKVLFIPQNIDDAFVDNLFVYEYVSLFNFETIIDLSERIQAEWLINIIKDKQKILLKELSQGQRQLLLLLVLLSKNEIIILFDEIFSSIDAVYHKKLWLLIRETIQTKSLISLFITHDYNFAYDNSDRLLVLHNGTLVADISKSKITKEQFLNKIYKG